MPFFIVRHGQRAPDGRQPAADPIRIVDDEAYVTHDAAEAAAHQRYPHETWLVVEAATRREAVLHGTAPAVLSRAVNPADLRSRVAAVWRRAGRELLLADADETTRAPLTAFLTATGFEVTAVTTARQLHAALAAQSPAMILLDAQMAGTATTTLVRELHATYPAIPLLLFTTGVPTRATPPSSALAAREIAEFIQLGACDVISKPFVLEHVVATVLTCFQRRLGEQ